MHGDDDDRALSFGKPCLSRPKAMYPHRTPRKVFRVQCALAAFPLEGSSPTRMRTISQKACGTRYDFLPEPTSKRAGCSIYGMLLPHCTRILGSEAGCNEYFDLMEVWNTVGGLPYDLYVQYPAVASFEHARQILAKVPDGFFLWVHVMTPHGPYLPDAADRGRFLPSGVKLRKFDEEGTPPGNRTTVPISSMKWTNTTLATTSSSDRRPRLRLLHGGPGK